MLAFEQCTKNCHCIIINVCMCVGSEHVAADCVLAATCVSFVLADRHHGSHWHLVVAGGDAGADGECREFCGASQEVLGSQTEEQETYESGEVQMVDLVQVSAFTNRAGVAGAGAVLVADMLHTLAKQWCASTGSSLFCAAASVYWDR